MALSDPTTSFLDDWYAAMMQQPASMPVGAPAPVGADLPAPAPLQIAPDPVMTGAPQAAAQPSAPVEPAPMMPGFESIADPSSWGGGTDVLPTPEMPLAPVGSGLDQYGFEKQSEVVPAPELPGMLDDSPVNPLAWGDDSSNIAPVGHTRTSVAPGEQGLSLDERQQLKLENPLAYEKLKIDETEDQAAQARAGMAQIARRDAEDAELSLRNFRESQQRSQDMMKQVELDVAALANEKPKKYEPGALDLVAGILGMLGASATGGKNVGLELVNQRIERHIQDQRDEYNRKAGNVDRRMNLIAKLRDAGYDDYQAGEVIRLSSLERAKQMLMTDIQNYDPQGTTARNKMAQYEAFNAAQAKAAEALRQRDLDEKIKQGEYFIKARKADDEHNKAVRAGMGGGAPSLGKQKFTPAELAQQFPGKPVPTDGIARTLGEYENWVTTSSKGEELLSKQRGNEQFESEKTRQFGINGPDGKPLLAADDKTPVQGRDIAEANKLTEQIADTDEVIRMMDEVLRLRAKHGWSSDLGKSPEWRKMQANWAGVILKKKSIDELGVIAGPDMDLMGKALGAEDPTSVFDPTPGIVQGRQNAVQGLHGRLRIKGVGDKSMPQYPETWKKQAPQPTAIDEAIEAAMTPGDIVDDRTDLSKAGFAGNVAEMSGGAKEPAAAVRSKIQYLEDTARGDGDQAAKARQGLAEIAKGATLPMSRDAAQQALRNLDASKGASK